MQKKETATYAKENNLLQLSLFYFGKERPIPKKTVCKWEDEQGNTYELICSCIYGVPSSLEMDTYTACMRLWVKQGMSPDGIKVSYSAIARELGVDPKNWVTKIKKSLIKLGQARYHFKKCFIVADEKGNMRMDAQFSLFDTTHLFSKDKKRPTRNCESILVFPNEIRKNLESKYYQLLDMDTYRSLPTGLAKRLYEYLAKRKYHGVNGVFQISEGVLCRWLPVKDKNTTNRRKRLAKISQSLVDIGYLESYEFDRKRKMCIFTYVKGEKPEQGDVVDVSVVEAKSKPSTLSTAQPVKEIPSDDLIALVKLKRIPKVLREIVADYSEQHGREYVERNILYANENSKRNYSTYLQKALADDWGKVWSEEQSIKQIPMQQQELFVDADEAIRAHEADVKRREEEKKLRVKEMEDMAERFKVKVKELGAFLRNMLKEKAQNEASENALPQAVRLRYLQLLAEALDFPRGVVNPKLAKDVWGL